MRSLITACLLCLIPMPGKLVAESSEEQLAAYLEDEVALFEALDSATTAARKPTKQQIIYATSVCCPQYGGTAEGQFCYGHNGSYSHSSPCFRYALIVLQQEQSALPVQQEREGNIIKIVENEISHVRDWYNFNPNICSNLTPQGGMDPRCCGPFAGTPAGACY